MERGNQMYYGELFVDTSGWGCYCDENDPLHEQAEEFVRLAAEFGENLVTTDWVLAELVTLLLNRVKLPHQRIVQIVEGIFHSPSVVIVHVSEEMVRAAWSLFKRHRDKRWTLVDCVSFIVMKQRGIKEALTTDHHFEQAGFVRLLK